MNNTLFTLVRVKDLTHRWLAPMGHHLGMNPQASSSSPLKRTKMPFEKLSLIREIGMNPPKSPLKRGTLIPVPPFPRGARGDFLGFEVTLAGLLLGGLCLGLDAQPSLATPSPYFQIAVTSNRDEIRADNFLTLREAISIVNGQLPLDRISPTERQSVKVATDRSRIEFQLPVGQNRINLNSALPAITAAKVTIDGGTSTNKSAIQNLTFTSPLVEITPAPNREIDRGLAIFADDITIRGLSIHGFQVGNSAIAQNLPAADIFIGTANYPQLDGRSAPRNILIENNWLGIRSDRSIPDRTSDFGVYVFNSHGTTIRHNAIAHHSASGIITQVNANNLSIAGNAIFSNGSQGMPDAIRLEGNLVNNQIKANLICGNDGSGIFIFKPASGNVKITDNQIQSNGRRLRRAAIHLMGNDHQVTNNSIEFQTGAGVAVSAFSRQGEKASLRNQITQNRFLKNEGLSIDLIADGNEAVEDFQDGDGINPPRNTDNRRRDTGNGAINAPRFLAREFYLLGDRVNLDGIADPGSEVEIYQVYLDGNNNGPLSKPLKKVIANARGQFQATFQDLLPGTVLSAISSDRQYGTSEPAENVSIALPGINAVATPTYPIPADCALAAVPDSQTAVAPPVPTVPPALTKISIARSVHFALDKSALSPASTQVLAEIVRVLKAHPTISIDLAGHTDPRAPQAYNQALGMRRAIAVRNYLLKQGISPQRMTIRSLGFKQRLSNERGVRPYALDRRVEFEYRDLRGGELEIIDRLDDLQLER
jgi:outer membrane protein OmpA-like peptidoglycan-associated protein